MNRNTILLCSISLLLLIAVLYIYTRDEHYSIQYLVKHTSALENQSFGSTPYECTQLCKQINGDEKDRIRCMDYCNLNSGFIPTLNMIPNGETLLYYL